MLPAQQTLSSNRRSCNLQAMNVSATPSDEIAAALASTMAQRLLENVTAGSPRRRNRIAHATWPARATAPVERSEAFAVATFKRRATRSSCSALLARAMKSLQPWPEPRPCSRRNRYSQPSTPRRPAQASSTLRRKRPRLLAKRCEATKQRVVFARSSASLITRPARVQVKTLNPKRFVSGRYWGGLKQPPRRAAPRPSGSRRAASRATPKP